MQTLFHMLPKMQNSKFFRTEFVAHCAIVVSTTSNIKAEIELRNVVYSIVILSSNGIWSSTKFMVNQESINSKQSFYSYDTVEVIQHYVKL